MSAIQLDAIRECLEGAIPAVIATADAAGTPNVAYLSQVQFIDSAHVALSYQFFNKTRQNILANPYAQLVVIHPQTAARFRLNLKYLRTETEGALFEIMKAKLAGIASHTGMSGVFRLLGSDVFHVESIEAMPGTVLPVAPRPSMLAAMRRCTQRLMSVTDFEHLLNETLQCLDQELGIHHAMILMMDARGDRLYTVASTGYDESGIGSEILLGQGVIGVAARERVPIRIGHMNAEYAYGRAIRDSLQLSPWAAALETEIPMPGLAESRSQMAVPIAAHGKLFGILYLESPLDMRFTYDDEDGMVALAAQLGMAIHFLQSAPEVIEPVAAAPVAASAALVEATDTLTVRHFAENDSVFLNGEYLIKGVAGSILWALLREYVDNKRASFTNRELRLDPRIRLPDVSDNLEARLLLLSRRLEERQAPVQIIKTGRGRFDLRVGCPVVLQEGCA